MKAAVLHALGEPFRLEQLADPVAAPGEAKSNVEVFRALALRMGFEDACFRDSEDDMIRTLLDYDHPFIKGITLDELDGNHSVRLRVARNGDPFLPFAAGKRCFSEKKPSQGSFLSEERRLTTLSSR